MKNHQVRCLERVWAVEGRFHHNPSILGHTVHHPIVCFSEPRNRRTDENLRRADRQAGKDGLSFPCKLSRSAFSCFSRDHDYLALSRNNCPFAEKKTLDESTCLLLPVPLCCRHARPKKTLEDSSRRRGKSGPTILPMGSGQDSLSLVHFKVVFTWPRCVQFMIWWLLLGTIPCPPDFFKFIYYIFYI